MLTKKSAVSFGLWMLALVAGMVCPGGAQAQIRAQTKTRLATVEESAAARSKLAPGLVAGIAGPLKVAEGQEFRVEGEGFPGFQLEPVRYLSHDEESGGTTYRCGVFLVFAQGAPLFLPTVGYEWTEAERCDGLDGIGFMEAGVGTPPRILLAYAAASPNAVVKEPMVLDWSARTQRYGGNEKLSRRLEDDDKAVGILGMKRQLKSYAGVGKTK